MSEPFNQVAKPKMKNNVATMAMGIKLLCLFIFDTVASIKLLLVASYRYNYLFQLSSSDLKRRLALLHYVTPWREINNNLATKMTALP